MHGIVVVFSGNDGQLGRETSVRRFTTQEWLQQADTASYEQHRQTYSQART